MRLEQWFKVSDAVSIEIHAARWINGVWYGKVCAQLGSEFNAWSIMPVMRLSEII